MSASTHARSVLLQGESMGDDSEDEGHLLRQRRGGRSGFRLASRQAGRLQAAPHRVASEHRPRQAAVLARVFAARRATEVARRPSERRFLQTEEA